MQERADFHGLSSKQKRVAELLAAGKTRAEAAKLAGVGERTVYLWLRDDTFRDYMRAEEQRLRGELTSVLRRSVLRAVQVLESALDSEDDSQRILAAKALVSAGARLLSLLEISDLHGRVDRLEQALGGTNTHGNGKFIETH